MLYRKTERGDRYRIAMGLRALTASSGPAPWSMAVDRLRQRLRKTQPLMGVKGALPPMLPPLPGERGSPSQFPRQQKKPERIFHENWTIQL